MLSTQQIAEMNVSMLGLGAPIEKDGEGYNKPDYVRMECIGMLTTELTFEEAYLALTTMQKYKNTQLTAYRDELEETFQAYEEEYHKRYPEDESWKGERALDNAKDGSRHQKGDYRKRELIYLGDRDECPVMMFQEYVENVDLKPYDGRWMKSSSGKFAMKVPYKYIDNFLDAVADMGRYGYEAPQTLKDAIEAYKEREASKPKEQEKSSDEPVATLTPTGEVNNYGQDIYVLSMNNWNFNQKLWELKDKGLKYVDAKSDKDSVRISTNERLLPRLLSFLKEQNVDVSPVENAPVIDRNKSDNKLIDVSKLNLPFKPFPFQIEDATTVVGKKKALLGHDMGCVSGKSKVRIKENGKVATREVYIDNLFKLIQKDPTIQIKSLVNGRFAYMPIKAVIDKGIRDTIRIETEKGAIECTPDHEIYTEHGWIEAEKLSVGDTIFSNGLPEKCIECGSTENLITYKYAKWLGYCKSCMTRLKKNGYKGVVKKVDNHGYIRLVGNGTKDMPDYEKMKGQGGIYEHHQVWYENTGHVVAEGEVVHHKDLNKRNNEFSNLQLMTDLEHKLLHADINKYSLPQFNENIDFVIKHGKKVFFVPQKTVITNIQPASKQKVYDIAIDDPEIHNFICNGIVVHNCGKTFISALVGMSIPDKKLVICPETLRLNWKRELEQTDGVNNGADIKVVYSKDKDPQFGKDWTIMGYKTAVKFAGLIMDEKFNCMFVDEAHKCKAVNNYGTPTSQQAKTVMALSQSMDYTYLLTGTPMPTRNKDLYNELVMLGEINPNAPFAFSRFGKKFCDGYNNGFGWNFDGSSNTDELHEILCKYMTRRLKSDVLPNLTKQRLPIVIEAPLSKDYRDIEKRLHHMEDGDTYMALAMTGRRHLSKCKADAAIEFADTLLEGDEPVVLVAEFNETLDKMMEHFGDNACCIRGGMTDSAKQQAVDDFQSGRKKVCCINLIAAGVGITLTKAHNMVICDFDWTPANMTQVEDRICRTGQNEHCNIFYICHEKAILDDIFMEMITDKSANIDKVVDNAENTVDLVGMKEGGTTEAPAGAAAFIERLKARIEEDNANGSSKPVKKSKPKAKKVEADNRRYSVVQNGSTVYKTDDIKDAVATAEAENDHLWMIGSTGDNKYSVTDNTTGENVPTQEPDWKENQPYTEDAQLSFGDMELL